MGHLNIVQLCSASAAPLDNPLDASCYDSIDQAMREFLRIYPCPMSADNLDRVRQHLIQHNLSRTAVHDLAMELSGLASQGKGG